MTRYEYLKNRAEYCEEQCRSTADSYMKEFWAKTADRFAKMSVRLTVAEAAAPYVKEESDLPRGKGQADYRHGGKNLECI